MKDRWGCEPGVLVRLLSRVVPCEVREAVLGDLVEDSVSRLNAGASLRAVRWWQLGQVVALAWSVRSWPRRSASRLTRTRRGDSSMLRGMHKMRHAMRSLVRRPTFTLLAVATLALGIGGSTAMFSLLDTVLLRPLPYPEADRLVFLWGQDERTGTGRSTGSYPDYLDLRERSNSFESLAAWRQNAVTLLGAGEAVRLPLLEVSANALDLFGGHAVLGRLIAQADEAPDAPDIIVLTYGTWRGQFGGDPGVLGRTLTFGGVSHEVVGVLAEGVPLPAEAAVLRPLAGAEGVEHRGIHNLFILGRLAQGIPIGQADDEIAAIAAQLEAEYPGDNLHRTAFLEPAHETVTGRVRRPIWLLFGAMVAVLAIAIVNVASLLLEHAASRRREVATRQALGAGRRDLLGQFLAEGFLLVALASGLGVALAQGLLRIVVASIPETVPRSADVAVDGRVLVFAVLVAGLTSLLATLAPFLEIRSGGGLEAALRDRTATGGRLRHRFRAGLVVLEVALAVVLVFGAGLLLRTLGNLMAVEPGFAHRDVVVLPLELDVPFVPEDWGETVDLFARIVERVRVLPGVASVSAGFQTPVEAGWETSFWIAGGGEPERGQRPEARYRPITPEYFETVGIPLVAGRMFDARDHRSAPGVAIVNEAFVRQHLAGGRALGEVLVRDAWWKTNPTHYEIVGVVADVAFAGPDVDRRAAMYFPHAQQPVNSMKLLVRPEAGVDIVPGLRRAVAEIEPDLPLGAISTLGSGLAGRLEQERFVTGLLGGFAGLALVLAAIGLFGLLSYQVTLRRREIGIRMALGAAGGQLARWLVARAGRLVLLGLTAGLLLASVAARWIESLLWGVDPADPSTFLLVAAVLVTSALVASLVPLRRALSVDPVVALHQD